MRGKRRTKQEDDAMLTQHILQQLVVLRFQYDKATEALTHMVQDRSDDQCKKLQDERARIKREIRTLQSVLRQIPTESSKAPLNHQPHLSHLASVDMS